MKKKNNALLWVAIGAALLFVITKKSAETVAPIAEGEPAPGTPDPTATKLQPDNLPPLPNTTLQPKGDIIEPEQPGEIFVKPVKPISETYDYDGGIPTSYESGIPLSPYHGGFTPGNANLY